MRRSLAPSQRNKLLLNDGDSNSAVNQAVRRNLNASDAGPGGTTTISRMPLFGFLEIPEKLNRQFRVPTGCVITEKTIELRKIKRLGKPNRFNIVRPGDNSNLLKQVQLRPSPDENADGDDDLEQLPTTASALPPFEPLVLWRDKEYAANCVEVSNWKHLTSCLLS